MISIFYPSKRVVVVTPPYINSPKKWSAGSSTEEQRAAAKGLSTIEYRERVVAVSKAQGSCFWYNNQILWPSQVKDAEEHGEVIIRGVCRHYDEYGEIEWHDPPFILAVSPVKNPEVVINCTANWVAKICPLISKEVC
jgi:hypothetical protein